MHELCYFVLVCGINLELTNGTSQVEIPRFVRSRSFLTHRGPDSHSEIFIWNGELGLGFNRLSIIDLSPNSMQPMTLEDGSLSLIFNGEIYNYLEIRSQLQNIGHIFRSGGDAEVILKAFQQWGLSSFDKFNGMWALAIVDNAQKKIFICRDRFGVKPLYYFKTPSSIVIASEIKAFAAYESFNYSLNSQFLNSGHLNPQNSSFTIFQDVRSVLPGHFIELRQDDMTMVQKRWWKTEVGTIQGKTNYLEQKEALRETIRESVRIRLRSDVPVALSLSSGIDSALVAMFASELTDGDIVAYCQGNSQDEALDEYEGSKQNAHALGIPLKKTNLPLPLDASLLLDSIFALDGSSFFGPGIYSHYENIRSDGIKVILEGHGGDELFGGYSSYYQELAQYHLLNGRLFKWNMAHNTYRQMNGLIDGSDSMYYLFRQLPIQLSHAAESKMRSSLRRLLKENKQDTTSLKLEHDILKSEIKNQTKLLSYTDALLYREFHYGTLAPILCNFDKLSMAHGLEVRSPLLDWRTVQMAFCIPGDAKLNLQLSKKILRDLLPQDMPAEIKQNKRKRGFTGYSLWLANSEVEELCLDTIHSEEFLDQEAWNGKTIKENVVNSFSAQDFTSIMQNWGYIQTAIFVRQMKSQAVA